LVHEILDALYTLVRSEAGKSGVKEGYEFEEKVSHKIYVTAKSLGIDTFPPRYSPTLPTLSGNKYQIDASFLDHNTHYFIECKRREFSDNEHVYYFNGKILDYKLAATLPGSVKGVFLSTASVDDSSKAYAITYGMTIIDPESPSIEQMIASAPNGSKLRQALLLHEEKKLRARARIELVKKPDFTSRDLLKEYKFLVRRWGQNAKDTL
jgi:hypothetical protein